MISIILVQHNGYTITKQCINSILKSTHPEQVEILVIDNASTDGSEELLERKYRSNEKVRIIKRTSNDFLTPAYNDAVKYVRGETMVFINNDMTVSCDWLIHLLPPLKDKHIGICGPVVLQKNNSNRIDASGCRINLLGYGYPHLRDAFYHKQKTSYHHAFSSPWFAIRKNVFDILGGFDEDYLAYYEDVDIGWRAGLMGYDVIVAKNAVVYHTGSWTIKKMARHLIPSSSHVYNFAYLSRRNRLLTLLKNAHWSTLTAILPLYIFTEIVYMFLETIRFRNLHSINNTLHAFAWNLSHQANIVGKRKMIQKKRVVSDCQLYKRSHIQ